MPAPPGRPVDPDILRRPDLALAWLAPRAPLIRAPVDALAPLQIPARCGRSFVVTDALDPGILEPEQLEEALTDGDDGIVLSAAGPWIFVLHHERVVFGAAAPQRPAPEPPALELLRASARARLDRRERARDELRAAISPARLDAARGRSRAALARELGLSLRQLLWLQGRPYRPRWWHELDAAPGP